jgi:hypothetical protein
MTFLVDLKLQERSKVLLSDTHPTLTSPGGTITCTRRGRQKKMEIIKTEGTRTSTGSYMVLLDNGDYLWDDKGNNAWDTYEEAQAAINQK